MVYNNNHCKSALHIYTELFRSQSVTLRNIGILTGIDTQTTWENVEFNSVQ